MKIELKPGDTLRVVLEDTDGEFTISYGGIVSNELTVTADLPDDSGREGTIYCETFGETPEDKLIGGSYFRPHNPEIEAELVKHSLPPSQRETFEIVHSCGGEYRVGFQGDKAVSVRRKNKTAGYQALMLGGERARQVIRLAKEQRP